MKTLTIFLSTVVLIGSLSLTAYAQDSDPSMPADASVTRPKPYVKLGLSGTMYNTYNRGNLDTWFAERTGDPNRAVDQGSPAYFSFEGALLLPVRPDELWVGANMGFNIPATHSLWGTALFFGGRQELELSPWVFSFGVPVRYRMGPSDRLFVTATPSLLMGWVTGTYSDTSNYLEFTPSPGFGFGIAMGAEMMFSKHFGANLDFGYRALKSDLSFSDNTSSTGYSQPTLNNGEGVQADLGGSFMTIGLSLHR